MNRYARFMKLEETTNFTNPHGLSDKLNHASPADVCRITSFALRSSIFRDVVRKRYHECLTISQHHTVNMYQWVNSNKLLNDYFRGVKTGTTPSAGPCLTCHFVRRDFSIVVCLLNSKTSDSRFKDMAILILWALDKHLQGFTAKDSGNALANAHYYNNWAALRK